MEERGSLQREEKEISRLGYFRLVACLRVFDRLLRKGQKNTRTKGKLTTNHHSSTRVHSVHLQLIGLLHQIVTSRRNSQTFTQSLQTIFVALVNYIGEMTGASQWHQIVIRGRPQMMRRIIICARVRI